MAESVLLKPQSSHSLILAVIAIIIAVILIAVYFSKKQDNFVPFVISTKNGKEVVRAV